jgi:hypothetical protein
MEIDLNNPNEFTIDNFRKLIASENDEVSTQFRITESGKLFLSKDVGNRNLDGIVFRLETNGAGNGYVGLKASRDDNWVNRVFTVVRKNWPNPQGTYSDDF